MHKNRVFAFLLALPSLASGYASAEAGNGTPSPEAAQPGATVIDADKLEIYLDRKMRAIGDAELRQDDKTIFGDRIDYDMLNSELHVSGNTRIEQDGFDVRGPELRLRLEDREGEMKEPVFVLNRKPQTDKTQEAIAVSDVSLKKSMKPGDGFSRGSAKQIVFEGPEKERLYSARYTTCEAGVDDWYLRAKELELDHHTETATASHASIEFKGVPILYTPWIDFSFNQQRKSGFLFPSFGTTTRSGAEFALPYYWNIAPNMDATVTPRILSKRGVQMRGEFRYLNADYYGQDNIELLPNDNQTKHDRYYAKLTHTQNFGHGWSGNYDIERISDAQYFSDLSTSITATSRVNLPQRGSLNYSDENWQFTGVAEQYQTLDQLSFPYQRLPQLTVTGNKEWTLLDTNLYSQWSNFQRSSLAPTTQNVTSASGATLNTGVTGSRTVLYPSISVPLESSYGFITPKLGVHYTEYNLSNTAFTLTDTHGNVTTGEYGNEHRTLPIFSLDSGLYFDRDVRVVKNRYTQTLEPRLFYVYVPYRDQSQLPMFDTSEADLNLSTLFAENRFTGNDRINDANQLTMAVTSRLIDANTGIERLVTTIGQRFYFGDRKITLPGGDIITNNSSDIVAAVTARLLTHWNVDAAWQYNTELDRSIKANLGARYNPEPGKTLNLSYRFTRESLEQIDLSSEWPLSSQWYSLARWNYSLKENRPIEGIAGVEYDAGCWQARAVMQRVSTATDAKPNYAFFFQLELGGMASIGTNPLTLLKRSIPGYTSTDLIPDEPR